jgi:hypothetical protein
MSPCYCNFFTYAINLGNLYTPMCKCFTRLLHTGYLSVLLTLSYMLLNVSGEVQYSKNGSTPVVFMHVDQTLQLWVFFDVYGSTQKVRILGSCVEPHHPHSSSGMWLYATWYMAEFCLVSTAVVIALQMVAVTCLDTANFQFNTDT